MYRHRDIDRLVDSHNSHRHGYGDRHGHGDRNRQGDTNIASVK